MMSCLQDRCFKFLLQNAKALLARLLFALHGLATIWRVADVCNKNAFFLLTLPLGLLLVEMLVTSFYTKSGEWKWFCPSVFLYLASVIPGIWLLHMDLYQARENYRISQGLHKCEEMMMFNETTLQEIRGISIPLILPEDEWASGLQQIMFALLLFGRWLLPKGQQLSRDQLSQLLLTYLGIAADSLEFSLETLNIGEVYCNKELIIAVLTIWTWSMLQFTLVRWSIANNRQPPSSDLKIHETGHQSAAKPIFSSLCPEGCCGSEIWTSLLNVVLQDAPFLIMRLYLILQFKVVNQMMLFFVIKNVLVIGLQFYRVAILLCCQKEYYDAARMNADTAGEKTVVLVDARKRISLSQQTSNKRQSRTLSSDDYKDMLF